MGWILKLLGGSAGSYIMSAVAIAFVALLAFAGVQSARLDNAKRDQLNPATGQRWKAEAQRDAKALGKLRPELAGCTAQRDGLRDKLRVQNAAVDQLRRDGEARARAAAAAIASAEKGRTAAERRAAQILAARPGADVCASAADLIDQSL